MAGEDALRHTQALAGVGVVRPNLDARQLADRDLLGGVVEENERERIAGELGADQVRERHGDALRRREAIFAVEDHGVRAVEQNDSRAGALVVRLVDVEVAVLDIQGAGMERVGRGVVALTREDAIEGCGDVEIEGVTELILLG